MTLVKYLSLKKKVNFLMIVNKMIIEEIKLFHLTVKKYDITIVYLYNNFVLITSQISINMSIMFSILLFYINYVIVT